MAYAGAIEQMDVVDLDVASTSKIIETPCDLAVGTEANKKKHRQTEEDVEQELRAIFGEEGAIEIPSTQSPPKEPKQRLTSKSLFMNYPRKPNFENKSLSYIKERERKTLISSPSIMSMKPARTEKLENQLPTPKKAKVSFGNDDVFNDLKYSSDPPGKIVEGTKEPTLNQRTSTSINVSTNEQNEQKNNLKPAVPIEKFQPDPEWSKVNSDSLCHLKLSTTNFRLVLDELKIAK